MDQELVVVEKKNYFWTVVKIILVLAVVTLIAVKIYRVIKKKKAAKQLEAEEAELLTDVDEDMFASLDEELYEASAEDGTAE